MVFDKKIKENIKINLKEKIAIKPEQRELVRGSIITMLSLIFFIIITIRLRLYFESINEIDISSEFVASYAHFIKMFSISIYIIFSLALIFLFITGILRVKKAFDSAIKKRSYDFDSKNLIYYISLSKYFKNKELNNFIIAKLRNIEKNKIIIMKDKIEDKDFQKNIVTFEKKLNLKESATLEKLENNKKEINQKIKESKKILGKKTKNVSISNN